MSTIYVDMDNVLLATFKGAALYAKKIIEDIKEDEDENEDEKTVSFSYNITVPDKDALYSYHTWDYLIAAGMHYNDAILMRKILFRSQDYWETIPFEDGAYEVFKWLYENHDVYIATSAFLSKADECILGKLRFIEKQMPWFDLKRLIYSHAKYKLRGDYMIEDVPSQLDGFNGTGIVFDRPYNRKVNQLHTTRMRVSNWYEIRKIFEELT